MPDGRESDPERAREIFSSILPSTASRYGPSTPLPGGVMVRARESVPGCWWPLQSRLTCRVLTPDGTDFQTVWYSPGCIVPPTDRMSSTLSLTSSAGATAIPPAVLQGRAAAPETRRREVSSAATRILSTTCALHFVTFMIPLCSMSRSLTLNVLCRASNRHREVRITVFIE
ncbi:hypothetical protein DSECCO2_307920 [anaerobic digester metagenome]